MFPRIAAGGSRHQDRNVKVWHWSPALRQAGQEPGGGQKAVEPPFDLVRKGFILPSGPTRHPSEYFFLYIIYKQQIFGKLIVQFALLSTRQGSGLLCVYSRLKSGSWRKYTIWPKKMAGWTLYLLIICCRDSIIIINKFSSYISCLLLLRVWDV